ncbi:MAG: hypothetical protein Q9182_004743 [Xanthomendoza sp. 2 TL-2023]
MGISNFLAGLRKPKADTTKQSSTIRDRGISSPRTLEIYDDPTTINLLKPGGLKRAPHIRRHNEPAQEAHLVQRHRRISIADLASDGDLGLQGGPHRIDELYPADEARRADSMFGRSRQISVTLGQRIRYPSESIVKTPVSKKFQVFQDLAQQHESTSVGQVPTLRFHSPTSQHPLPPPLPARNRSTKDRIKESSFRKDFGYIRPLGEGSFGKVSLYKHNHSARLLAVKTTRKPPPVYIAGVPSEVHIIRDILGNSHAHLPKLYHFHHSPTRLEYWMDFCNGGDLFTLQDYYITRSLPVPEGFIWHAFIHLASALAFLHTGTDRADPEKPPPKHWQPVIHRDIKPENIFLKLPPQPTSTITYPTLILGDFGLATTDLTSPTPGQDLGTPAFQPRHLPHHTIASDTYALGAIIHHLALSFPPFSSSSSSSSFFLQSIPIHDVTDAGYSPHLQTHIHAWLHEDDTQRPVGLQGVLRAEAGQVLWLGDGGVEVGVAGWERWVREGGAERATLVIRNP